MTGLCSSNTADDFTPAAVALAKHFHDLYEERAPLYGYVTREDTRQFDPASTNGRLMIAVCQALLDRRIIRMGFL